MITYRLQLTIHDNSSETPSVAVLHRVASLDVHSLQSINDQNALDMLADILRGELLPQGSTVEELRALAAHDIGG